MAKASNNQLCTKFRKNYMATKNSETLKNELIVKIRDLPDYRVREVLDFVDFLSDRMKVMEDSLLNISGCLSGKPMTSEEIDKELYGG